MDTARRLRELTAAVAAHIVHATVALCMEGQSWLRNASSAVKVSMNWGVVCTLTERHTSPLPVFHASPQALTNHKTTTKHEVIGALKLRYLDLPPWKEPWSCGERAADAAGVVVASLDHLDAPLARRLACAEDGATCREPGCPQAGVVQVARGDPWAAGPTRNRAAAKARQKDTGKLLPFAVGGPG